MLWKGGVIVLPFGGMRGVLYVMVAQIAKRASADTALERGEEGL